MKNFKFVVGLMLVGLLVISGSAVMAQQILIAQPTAQPTEPPQRDPQQPDVPDQPPADPNRDPVGDPQWQVQPEATTPPRRGVSNLVVVTDVPTFAGVGMTCSEDNDGDGDTDSCSCPAMDSDCMGDLIAWCNQPGDYLTGTGGINTCIAGGNPSSGDNSDD